MDQRLLVIDTETGGLDADVHSVLSIGAVVWAPGIIGDTLEIFISEDTVSVQPDALRINKADLVWLRDHGVSPTVAVSVLETFVRSHFDLSDHKTRVGLAGHNLGFDIPFLKRLYRQTGFLYCDLFSHRTIDTAGILRFLTLAGLLPLSEAGSTEAFEYFQIAVPSRHTALADAVATAQLLDKLVALLLRQDLQREASSQQIVSAGLQVARGGQDVRPFREDTTQPGNAGR